MTGACEPLSAQCPDCSLHALVPIQVAQDGAGGWRQLVRGRVADASTTTIDACPVCCGLWIDHDRIGDDAGATPPTQAPSHRRCPRGHGPMDGHRLPDLVAAAVDRCPVCRGLWISGAQRRALLRSSTPEARAQRIELAARGLVWVVQLVTRLPVELDNPARGTPWTLYSISAALVAVYVASVLGVVYARDFALYPGALRDDPGRAYTVSTHIFFHADWFHLLGNLYFFYLFGHAVEHIFGRRRFLALFLVAGILGGVAEALFARAAMIPVIGASGAIAGVMGAHLWIYPRVRILQVIPILFIQLELPVWTYLGMWLLSQAAMAVSSDVLGMAWHGHIAGFLSGLALTLWVLPRRRREVASSVRHPCAGHAAPRRST